MKLRYAIMLLLSLALPLFPEAAQPNQIATHEETIETASKAADSFVDFEYIIASLASATYQLIDTQKTTEYHPYLELHKEHQNIIDSLDTFFYKKGGYDALVRTFKFNKQTRVKAAIAFFKKVAHIIHVTLPSHAGLVLQEEKLDWLKTAYKRINKKYKTFEPRLKSEDFFTSLRRTVLLNPVTRYFDLVKLSQAFSGPIAGTINAIFVAYWSKRLIKDTTTDSASFNNANAILLAAIAGQVILCEFLQKFEKEKKDLLKRDQFVKISQKEEEMKKQFHRLLSHTGTGDGFSSIVGIQDANTIEELTWFADWLRKPISYFGSKLAVMLYGEPGNGKGIITKALADESNTPIITISADDVKSEKINLKLWAAEHIAQSRDAKSVIVFFDEIDLIVPPKDTAALQSFLTFLDGTQKQNPHVRILYIFATNYIQKLDPRLLRPGRFKSKIYVGPPTQEQRAKLIETTILAIFKVAPKELVEQLAVETNGFSRVAIDEAIANTYNHMALTEETPSIESFIYEIKKLKEVTYHRSEQIA